LRFSSLFFFLLTFLKPNNVRKLLFKFFSFLLIFQDSHTLLLKNTKENYKRLIFCQMKVKKLLLTDFGVSTQTKKQLVSWYPINFFIWFSFQFMFSWFENQVRWTEIFKSEPNRINRRSPWWINIFIPDFFNWFLHTSNIQFLLNT